MGRTRHIGEGADFTFVRYAQCWEDADILLEALDIGPDSRCLSIASAGDNTLSMLSKGPRQVVALDLNPAQLACLELRVAAFRRLEHAELLQLVGYEPCASRKDLYRSCREQLSASAQHFWDTRQNDIQNGIGHCGKFERYLALFRDRILPFIHPKSRIDRLFLEASPSDREASYAMEWDTWQWRWLLKIFCSRPVMGRLGRDPRFFKYVKGNVADRFLARIHYALTTLDPAQNPYLQWILRGPPLKALPHAFRPENFDTIRDNLDALSWRLQSVEAFLENQSPHHIDCFNLSNIFEYMSPEHYHEVLEKLIPAGTFGARLAYWNLLVPRRRPDSLAKQLRPLDDLSCRLHLKDRTFFYSDFVVEEIIDPQNPKTPLLRALEAAPCAARRAGQAKSDTLNETRYFLINN